MIEDQKELENFRSITKATPPISFRFLGSIDFSDELSSNLSQNTFQYLHCQFVLATTRARKNSKDGPSLDLSSISALMSETRAIVVIGFTSKAT